MFVNLGRNLTKKMKLRQFFVFLLTFIGVSSDHSILHCGRRFEGHGLAYGGAKSQQNAWPWLVAFENLQKNKFVCSGSLISNKHVLSGEKKNN